MGPFAWDKMVLIFLVVLVLFGPKELPKVARTIAKFMNDFKRARNELQETWQRELSALERETQDIRKDLNIETDQLTQTNNSYSESYYHHDSSYDYGSSEYQDSNAGTTAAGSVAAAEAATEPVAEAAETTTGAPAGEAAREAESPAPASEPAPTVTVAQGTVPTDGSPTSSAEPPGEKALS